MTLQFADSNATNYIDLLGISRPDFEIKKEKLANIMLEIVIDFYNGKNPKTAANYQKVASLCDTPEELLFFSMTACVGLLKYGIIF